MDDEIQELEHEILEHLIKILNQAGVKIYHNLKLKHIY